MHLIPTVTILPCDTKVSYTDTFLPVIYFYLLVCGQKNPLAVNPDVLKLFQTPDQE